MYLVVHRRWGAVAAVEDRVEVEVSRSAASGRALHPEQIVQVSHRVHLRFGGVGAVRGVVEGDGGVFEFIGTILGLFFFS